MELSFNLNFQPGLEFHSEVVLPDDDSLEPALYQGLVEGVQVCGLLLNKILQFIDAGNLCVPIVPCRIRRFAVKINDTLPSNTETRLSKNYEK